MDLKKIDLDKLQDYAFTPHELAAESMVSNQKFINIKCLDNESLIPTVKAIPIAKIKQEREKQAIKCTQTLYSEKYVYAVKILDKLLSESEE